MKRTRRLVCLAVAGMLPLIAVGCGGDAGGDGAASTAPGDDSGSDGAGQDTGTPSADGGSSHKDGGEGGASGDDSGATPAADLYGRVGGHDGLRSKIDAVMKAELGDPAVASFFVYQTKVPVPQGHPTLSQLSECLTDFLGNGLGGKENYPTVVSDNTGMFFCRNIVAIHFLMDISGGTFERFVMIAAGALQQEGVSNEDIRTIGQFLEGQKTNVIYPGYMDAGVMGYDGGPFAF
jgi:hypothetical protein